MVGFLTFENAEQLQSGVEVLFLFVTFVFEFIDSIYLSVVV